MGKIKDNLRIAWFYQMIAKLNIIKIRRHNDKSQSFKAFY